MLTGNCTNCRRVLPIALTSGILSSIGMSLVSEGVSDCIDGVRAILTGEFSWKSRTISKVISIGVSLIGSGIGKVVDKGFKGCKTGTKVFVKDLKC